MAGGGRFFVYAFGAGFLLGGGGALWAAVSAVREDGLTGRTASLVLVGLLFALVGVGAIALARSGARSDKRREADPRGASEPWRVEGKWEDFAVPSDAGSELLGWWIAAAFASLFVSPFVLVVMPAETTTNAGRVVIGLLAAGAAALVLRAVVLTLRFSRHGTAMLHLAQLPMLPGGAIEAVFIAPGELEAGAKVRAILRVRETRATRRGTGSDRSTRYETRTVAESELAIDRRDGGSRILLGIRGALPEAPPRDENANPSIAWELTVRAKQAGADLVQSFDLPVYAADEARVERRAEPWPA